MVALDLPGAAGGFVTFDDGEVRNYLSSTLAFTKGKNKVKMINKSGYQKEKNDWRASPRYAHRR
jgi:hypothetical protein